MTMLDAPSSETGGGRGVRRPVRDTVLDPILVGLAALVIYAVHGFQSPVNRDLGMFVYGGEQFAHGVPPYVGIFNTVGPLADATPGVAIWLGQGVGVDPVLSARLLFLVLSALSCALVSVLARDTLRSRIAGVLAPAFFLTFECFTELASAGPREKTTMLVFLVAGLILTGRRHWLGAGVCAALATLTWQPALFVAAAAVLVATLTAGSGRSRALLRFVVGGLIPTVVTAAYFGLEGASRQAWDGFFVVNQRYTSQPTLFNDWVVRALWNGYHLSLVLLVIGLVSLLVLAGRAAPRAVLPAGSEATVEWHLTAIGAGAVAAVTWTILVVNGGPDLFVLLPFAALGLGGSVTWLLTRLSPRVVPAVAVGVVVACVAVSLSWSLGTRKDDLATQRADARRVLRTQPGDATILSDNAPQALAVAGRRSIWPFQVFDTRMTDYLDATLPGGSAGLADRVARDRPTFVIVGGHEDPAWLTPALARDYTRIGAGPGWVWYVRSDVGRKALQAARRANDAVMSRARERG